MLGDYDRVLKQRTALLKSARARGIRGDALSTLDVWDDKLVALGTQVIDARVALADELAAPLAAAYAAIAGADHRPELEWALSVQGGDPEEGAALRQGQDPGTVTGSRSARIDRRHVPRRPRRAALRRARPRSDPRRPAP